MNFAAFIKNIRLNSIASITDFKHWLKGGVSYLGIQVRLEDFFFLSAVSDNELL